MKYKLLKAKFYYNNKLCKHIYERKKGFIISV